MRSSELGYLRDELVIAGAGREGRLREALSAVAGDYDLILIDCAPSLDQLTINGLTAAQGVIVVTHSKLFSTNGLAQLLDTIDSVKQHYNPTLIVAGVIVNQHEEQTVSGRTWLDELHTAAENRGLTVLNPPIPKRSSSATPSKPRMASTSGGVSRRPRSAPSTPTI